MLQSDSADTADTKGRKDPPEEGGKKQNEIYVQCLTIPNTSVFDCK